MEKKIYICENIYSFGENIYTVCGNDHTFGRNIYYPLYNDISKQQVAVDSYPIEITVENVANSEFISLFLYQPECVLYLYNGIVTEFQCLL